MQDCSYYEGYFYKGLKQGKGGYYWKDGSNYIGEWKNNMINGYVD